MKFNHVLPKQSNYNSVNINSNGDALNMSNEGVSSGTHLSQQNLIKIMKKFKSSGNPMINIVNKENVNPPNIIMTGQQKITCSDSLHPSGSTTPTD